MCTRKSSPLLPTVLVLKKHSQTKDPRTACSPDRAKRLDLILGVKQRDKREPDVPESGLKAHGFLISRAILVEVF